MHVLEAGDPVRPCVLLLHGFPELAYSWRKVMPALAQAGYYAIAPDQRGYGATTGWDERDLASFSMRNIVKDAIELLGILGIGKAHVVGHDFGSPVAAYAAMTRPDRCHSVVLMSAPFGGAPVGGRAGNIHEELAKLGRKHYQWYFSMPEADADMRRCPQGVHAFLRAYYHYKSADWPGNRPFPLAGWTAAELAKMPTYYIMELGKGMAETVAPHKPAKAPAWLTDEELAVYADAFERTGFQGGLNWYRVATDPRFAMSSEKSSIDIPSMYIAGASDWGIYQKPGELERMRHAVCKDFRGAHFVDGAGHWVQQERPEAVCAALIRFLADVKPAGQ